MFFCDWTFGTTELIQVIGSTLTLFAIMVSLHIANRNNKVRLKVKVEYCKADNIGHMVVSISNEGFTNVHIDKVVFCYKNDVVGSFNPINHIYTHTERKSSEPLRLNHHMVTYDPKYNNMKNISFPFSLEPGVFVNLHMFVDYLAESNYISLYETKNSILNRFVYAKIFLVNRKPIKFRSKFTIKDFLETIKGN